MSTRPMTLRDRHPQRGDTLRRVKVPGSKGLLRTVLLSQPDRIDFANSVLCPTDPAWDETTYVRRADGGPVTVEIEPVRCHNCDQLTDEPAEVTFNQHDALTGEVIGVEMAIFCQRCVQIVAEKILAIHQRVERLSKEGAA